MISRGFSTQSRAIQLAFVTTLLVLWDFVGERRLVSHLFVPPLRLVALKFVDLLQSSVFYGHLTVTVLEMLAAFGLAASAGLLIGLFVGRSAYATVVLEPLFAGLFSIPIVIFLPLFILFFGLGMESKIAFGATYGFFPIVLNTIGGVAQVDRRYIRVAVSMGATNTQVFRRVFVPGALPAIVNGLRIGFILSFLAVIGGETIAGLQGLGTAIAKTAEAMRTVEMFAYIIFVVLLAALLNWLLTVGQRALTPAGAEQ